MRALPMKLYLVLMLICAVCTVFVIGCAGTRSEDSQAAIDYAETLGTVEQKTQYLVTEAKKFYNSDNFQVTVDLAQYVLMYLDRDSSVAKDLINEAKARLLKIGTDKAQQLKQKLTVESE